MGRLLAAIEGGEELREPEAQLLERAELLLDAAEMPPHGVADPVLGVEQRPDLLERQADAAEGEQAVQALHVGRRVQPVPAVRALGRHEQPDAVVVMQRADGHARDPGQLADLHGLRVINTPRTLGPHVT